MKNEPLWLDSMLSPSFYPHNPERIQLIQTHLSWVFLAGSLVYKVKKPVDFGFLDFTTLEKRRFFCSEEIRLNRRLCPEIYLGTVPVNRKENGEFALDGPGQTVEWAVEMKRMPDDGLMSVLIERDEIEKRDLKGIKELLIPFYRLVRAPEDKLFLGGLETVRENCEENFSQLRDFVGNALSQEVYQQIMVYTRQFMAENEELFSRRQKDGWIVEGHGDLYSANICFDRGKDRIYIFDCIEFNERFRYGDVGVDVAFLCMDLDFLGLSDLSNYFARIFQQDLNDTQLENLLDFYKCYRAVVRGKIGCFTWASPGVDEKTRNRSMEQAKRYFKLAFKYAGGIKKTPDLFVFMGLSGSGKSTAAEKFAIKRGIPVYNSDFVRKKLISGISATESRLESFGKGIYSSAFTDRTYRALARLAGKRLVIGQSAVLDATYIDAEKRRQLRDLTEAAGARLVLIVCGCAEHVIEKRLRKRAAQKVKVSDGRMEIYEKQKEIFSEPGTGEADEIIRLDTDRPVEKIIAQLEKMLP